MSGYEWSETQRSKHGAVLEEIDRHNFTRPYTFWEVFGNLNRESLTLGNQVAIALAKAVDSRDLTTQLAGLIDRSIRHHFCSGVKHLTGLWAQAVQCGITEWVPTNPKVAKAIGASLYMLNHLHSFHGQGGVLHGEESGQRINEAEITVLGLIKDLARVARDFDTDPLKPRDVPPSLELQEKVLHSLLSFNARKGPAWKRDHEEKDPVRQKLEEVVIGLVGSYDETLVLELSTRFPRQLDLELLERGFLKRFGRSNVLAGFLAHRTCEAA